MASSANIVAILADDASSAATSRLQQVLQFFELPYETYNDTTALEAALVSQHKQVAVIAPITCEEYLTSLAPELADNVHSAFLYLTEEVVTATKGFERLPGAEVEMTIASDSALAGPLQNIRTTIQPESSSYAFRLPADGNTTSLIESRFGSSFFAKDRRFPMFVSCTTELIDLEAELSGSWFDVRKHFLSAVPLVMFLKWALPEQSWKSHEAGACFIVDDPLLQSSYGFCNFVRLDEQMRQRDFATSIAMIPWNANRTSTRMAELMMQSNGRLSACVHGCDHTRHEFALRDPSALNRKTSRAVDRMNAHARRTGIAHDAVMVFPQGAFSSESLLSLQQHRFLAAVNTDAKPAHEPASRLTIRDTWSVAIMKHASFPLFTRRYPSHGLANFAFDLLLGKPCLVVEHHQFFRGNHQAVLEFVSQLNSMSVKLQWRNLAAVLRHCYSYREASDSSIEIRMFANELQLINTGTKALRYSVSKADAASAGVKAVRVNDKQIAWQTDGCRLTFDFSLPSGAAALIQVEYAAAADPVTTFRYPCGDYVKIAARRYLSEFRDNFLSRHDGLLKVAQGAKSIAGSNYTRTSCKD